MSVDHFTVQVPASIAQPLVPALPLSSPLPGGGGGAIDPGSQGEGFGEERGEAGGRGTLGGDPGGDRQSGVDVGG